MRSLFSVVLLLAATYSFGQYDPNYRKSRPRNEDESGSPFNVGLGLGLNYGGLGARLEVVPQKHFALFGAIGYNFHKAGFNVGGKIRVLPDKKACPIFQFMYGYNAVLLILDVPELNKTYYGPSIEGGAELRVGHDGNFMEFGVIIPFRSQEFSDDIKAFRNSGGQISDPLPFAISIGYHFRF